MKTITINLQPDVKQYEAHGREKHVDVHFRVEVKEYTRSLNDYSDEARKASKEAVAAYDAEIMALLTAEGWKPRCNIKYGPGSCPEMVKGAQFLYCHPHDISGNVLPEDVEPLAKKIAAMKSCEYRLTDIYGDIIITTSSEDESKLYYDSYTDGDVQAVMAEELATKRSNLYKDKMVALRNVVCRLAIENRRTDLDHIGSGYYRDRQPLTDFVMEHYNRLLAAGWIKEGTAADGRRIARYANKAEKKALNKKR